jgi:large subunit ribosomal protein L4
MKIEVINKEGKSVESVEINNNFDSENLSHVFYLVHNFQNHQSRNKTACAKTRAEVKGGGAKPYKQKGTGRARRGTNRSPLRRGGGVIFGPRPIKRRMKINKDIVWQAIKSALLLEEGKLKIIKSDGIDFKTIKTSFLKDKEDTKILLIVNNESQDLINSFRNFKNCIVVNAQSIRLQEVISSELILLDYAEKGLLERV